MAMMFEQYLYLYKNSQTTITVTYNIQGTCGYQNHRRTCEYTEPAYNVFISESHYHKVWWGSRSLVIVTLQHRETRHLDEGKHILRKMCSLIKYAL